MNNEQTNAVSREDLLEMVDRFEEFKTRGGLDIPKSALTHYIKNSTPTVETQELQKRYYESTHDLKTEILELQFKLDKVKEWADVREANLRKDKKELKNKLSSAEELVEWKEHEIDRLEEKLKQLDKASN